MATISLDYDSKGYVEIILQDKIKADPIASYDGSPPPEQEIRNQIVVGQLNFKAKEVRLRVSSKRLMSSSRYFRAMFERPQFREAKDLKEHEFVAIKLLGPEDDPTAMIIVLGILYDNDVQVPTEIDLQTLHKIATLVDKYHWHAAVAPLAASWFKKLEDDRGLPDNFNDSLLMWLWIAWVFGIKSRFKKLSRTAQQYASESIDLDDEKILFPSSVLKAINDLREAGLVIIEEELEAFKEELTKFEPLGKSESHEKQMLRYMVLGHATLLAQDLELAEFAKPDYEGISLRLVLDRIKTAQSTRDFVFKSPNTSASILAGGPWDLKFKLEKAMKSLNMHKWGVDYNDIKLSSTYRPRKRKIDSITKA